MRVILAQCAGAVDEVLVVNDDEAEAVLQEMRIALDNSGEDGTVLTMRTPISKEEFHDYCENP